MLRRIFGPEERKGQGAGKAAWELHNLHTHTVYSHPQIRDGVGEEYI